MICAAAGAGRSSEHWGPAFMTVKARRAAEARKKIPEIAPAGRTGSLEAAMPGTSGGLKRFIKLLGPGLITGASDDDPSGISTYAIAGASFGFATLWMALVTLPMMAAVQYMCAKIGMVSGRGLAGVLKTYYPGKLLYITVFSLVIANSINAGADIGAIAAGINLLIPIPVWSLIAPIALAVIALQIWGSYRLIASIFKWLTLALFAYVLSAFFCKPSLGDVMRGTLLPSFPWNRAFIALTVGILGTTISPYMFFWQSNQEVEEEIAAGRRTLAQRKRTRSLNTRLGT